MKKYNIFTANSTDMTHGGISSFNYKYINYLLKRNFFIQAYFINNRDIYKNEINQKNLLKKNRYYNFQNIWLIKKKYLNIFDRIFNYNFISLKFNKIKRDIKKNDVNISTKIEWSLILSKNKIKNYCLLDDPVPLQIYYNLKNYNLLKRIFSYIKYIIHLYLYYSLEKKFNLNKYCRFYTHAFQHIKFYKKFGLKVKYLAPFELSQKKSLILEAIKFQKKNEKINVLFLGRANSTASKSFFLNFSKIVKKLKDIKKYNFYFLSDEDKINYKVKDFNYFFIKKRKKINFLMKKMSLGMYLGDYDVGVRQRIIFMMSYGLPVLCHEVNKHSLIHLKDNKNILFYKKNEDLYKKFNYLALKNTLPLLKIEAMKAQQKFYDEQKNLEIHYKNFNN